MFFLHHSENTPFFQEHMVESRGFDKNYHD